MFYENDFKMKSIKVVPPSTNNEAFTVILNKSVRKRSTYLSIAKAFQPLSYFSSLVAMNPIRYSKGGINVVNFLNKIYCIFILTSYVTIIMIIRQKVTWKITLTDLPLTIISKSFTAIQLSEIIYDIFIISFGNSANYIKLFHTIDDIDEHFNKSKKLYVKRKVFAVSVIGIVIIVIACTWLIKNFNVISIITYFTFLFILLQGVNCVFFAIIMYVQYVQFNDILLKKIGKIPRTNSIVFDDDLTIYILKKMFSDPCYQKSNSSYCWFELMQIYDKICDCIHIFNNIYSKQILLMLSSWLLSTILAICRSISPSLKNSDMKTTDLYYYVFINLRPLFVTMFSELFIGGRRKTLSILMHNLIHLDLDPEYRNQIETMITLVKTRQVEISAQVCPLNLKIMFDFAGRVISYTILIIQHFYSRQ